MRYTAAEKLEIIRLVEQSSLSVRRTLAQLGIPRSTFYAWYERYLARGAGALEDGQPAPRRVWNKLPDTVAEAVLALALEEPELSPRELAVSFVDRQRYFVSESSVYRLLKAHDLITSPAFCEPRGSWQDLRGATVQRVLTRLNAELSVAMLSDKEAAQGRLADHNHVVEALATNRSD